MNKVSLDKQSGLLCQRASPSGQRGRWYWLCMCPCFASKCVRSTKSMCDVLTEASAVFRHLPPVCCLTRHRRQLYQDVYRGRGAELSRRSVCGLRGPGGGVMLIMVWFRKRAEWSKCQDENVMKMRGTARTTCSESLQLHNFICGSSCYRHSQHTDFYGGVIGPGLPRPPPHCNIGVFSNLLQCGGNTS